jgi:tetratricopeptide (TPR) repeat protein
MIMDPALAQLKEAQSAFFRPANVLSEQELSKNAQDALRHLLPLYQRRQKVHKATRQAILEVTGFAHLQAGEPLKAAKCFEESDNKYQAGLAYLVGNAPEKTHVLWSSLMEEHPFHWCLTVWGCLHAQLDSYPSFFQVRNHLEASIGQFYRYNRADIAEALIAYADVMAHINLETYKYIGRALMNHNHDVARAESFLLKNQKMLPNDPEVYYHLAQLRYAQGDDDDALVLLNQCITINYAYTPAQELRTHILANPSATQK